VSLLRVGIIGRSAKENEYRLPIHPDHLARLDPDVAAQITLEHGYGEKFGRADIDLAPLVGRLASRAQILQESDVVLLLKPLLEDVEALPVGQILWGWPHCVQNSELTQLAIDHSLTLIAFEAMNHWTRDQAVGLHVFHKNNELAGYCSVLHGLQLIGRTGDYGRRLTAAVIGFGATARGAVTALSAQGIHDVAVLTTRGVAAVASPIHSVRIVQFDHDSDGGPSHVITTGGRIPLGPFLAERDIVVNCTLQDPSAPLMYLRTSDLDGFRPGSLIVDVSCDEGMGFDWARPTTFDEPMFEVGDHVSYYGVDHTPSYLWDSATWDISEALIPFLRPVMEGPDAWEMDETLSRAVEIQDGRVKNTAILNFQHRNHEHPHAVSDPL
jgi:alanine dehydrogenase